MRENYQKMLEEKITVCRQKGEKPSLLLHVCCAPCSSYVLEYIAGVFDITAYFYNPNISSEAEFLKRERELERFVGEFGLENVKIVTEKYDHAEFLRIAKGKESVPEGGERCYDCYTLRLEKTAKAAKAGGFDLFTTTLSISPHKNADWLNEIGQRMGEKYGVEYLFADFKKRNGYKRSCELSREYNLYRQSFCGCEFSQAEAIRREKNKNIIL
ncbi:MAG: epoxyqueuosine reductase QueH [Clostridia bacterium]|nr:epoxyqueuosine reductase QueH [Clostridia bacterium]